MANYGLLQGLGEGLKLLGVNALERSNLDYEMKAREAYEKGMERLRHENNMVVAKFESGERLAQQGSEQEFQQGLLGQEIKARGDVSAAEITSAEKIAQIRADAKGANGKSTPEERLFKIQSTSLDREATAIWGDSNLSTEEKAKQLAAVEEARVALAGQYGVPYTARVAPYDMDAEDKDVADNSGILDRVPFIGKNAGRPPEEVEAELRQNYRQRKVAEGATNVPGFSQSGSRDEGKAGLPGAGGSTAASQAALPEVELPEEVRGLPESDQTAFRRGLADALAKNKGAKPEDLMPALLEKWEGSRGGATAPAPSASAPAPAPTAPTPSAPATPQGAGLLRPQPAEQPKPPAAFDAAAAFGKSARGASAVNAAIAGTAVAAKDRVVRGAVKTWDQIAAAGTAVVASDVLAAAQGSHSRGEYLTAKQRDALRAAVSSLSSEEDKAMAEAILEFNEKSR